MQLDGKVAIVTGAGRGIGKGVAIALVKSGAKVLIIDREEQPGRQTETELQRLGEASFLPLDLSAHDRLYEVVDAALARFGQLDVLVNAAQAAPRRPDRRCPAAEKERHEYEDADPSGTP